MVSRRTVSEESGSSADSVGENEQVRSGEGKETVAFRRSWAGGEAADFVIGESGRASA